MTTEEKNKAFIEENAKYKVGQKVGADKAYGWPMIDEDESLNDSEKSQLRGLLTAVFGSQSNFESAARRIIENSLDIEEDDEYEQYDDESEKFKKGDRVFAIGDKSIMEASVLREAKTDPMDEPCYRLEAGYRFRPMIKASKIFRTYEEAEECLQRLQNADIWPDELHDMDDRRHWI